MVIFEKEIDVEFDFEGEAIKIIDFALDELNCPYEYEVNLLITDEESIREINNEYRGIDKVTDVLSFPTNEFETIGTYDEDKLSFDFENGYLLLGDIVINYYRIVSQAEEYGHSFLREYAFLLVHSVLHLLGYDHMVEEDEKLMFDKQKEILAKMGITR